MEDSHMLLYSLIQDKQLAYMAVFDGHGGRAAAEWCGEHLHEYLQEEIKNEGDMATCMDRAFRKADEHIIGDSGIASGTTAAVCVISADSVRYDTNILQVMGCKLRRCADCIVEEQKSPEIIL
jgi:protein phosphatase PTC1